MPKIPLVPIPELDGKSFDSRLKVAEKSEESRLIVDGIPIKGEISEIIKKIMINERISQGEITKLLNMKSQSGVSQALNRDMRISMILRFLEVLNCEIIVKHNDKEYKVVANTAPKVD